MATLALAVPLLPGGKERLLKLAEAVKGEKYEQHQDFFRRHNFQEQWFLQQTPMGDMVLLVLESDDIPGVFQSVAQSTDPYDLNHFAEAKAIHGVDFTQPPTGPLPELLFDSRD